MMLSQIPEGPDITHFGSLTTFGGLGALACTSKANRAFVNQLQPKLLRGMEPVLADHAWLRTPRSDSTANKMAALAASLFAAGFDIRNVSPTKAALTEVVKRASLARNNPATDHALIAMYSRIPGHNSAILIGAPREQARAIRRWMEDHRADLAQVTTLNLSGLYLRTLPQELDIYFPNLHILDLSWNQLQTVPDFDLPDLRTLNLEHNQLERVPNFTRLSNLHILNLSRNKLTAVPDFDLPDLRTLNLRGNQLKTVPNFTRLSKLHILNLSWNHLENVPNFAHLLALYMLNLSINRLETVPNFTRLPNLHILLLESNRLWIVPNFDLSALRTLYLAGNNEFMAVPDFDKLNSLTRIFGIPGRVRTLLPWQTLLCTARAAIESLTTPSVVLRMLFMTMHDVNITWQRDLRGDVIRAYNASKPDRTPLPTTWEEADLDSPVVIDQKALAEAFTTVAWPLTVPPV